VVRFERACTMLERPPPRPGLAEVAAACGYFDQAHMSREWRQLAGCSPTTWMAEELPSVQDSGVDTRAS
jgi:AraC-like DNA-binding protein